MEPPVALERFPAISRVIKIDCSDAPHKIHCRPPNTDQPVRPCELEVEPCPTKAQDDDSCAYRDHGFDPRAEENSCTADAGLRVFLTILPCVDGIVYRRPAV
jgi:hypothetical protein